jgi:hypothetical protein
MGDLLWCGRLACCIEKKKQAGRLHRKRCNRQPMIVPPFPLAGEG